MRWNSRSSEAPWGDLSSLNLALLTRLLHINVCFLHIYILINCWSRLCHCHQIKNVPGFLWFSASKPQRPGLQPDGNSRNLSSNRLESRSSLQLVSNFTRGFFQWEADNLFLTVSLGLTSRLPDGISGKNKWGNGSETASLEVWESQIRAPALPVPGPPTSCRNRLRAGI